MSTRKKREYQPGRVKPLVERAAVWAVEHGGDMARMRADEDFSYLHALIEKVEPEYGDPSRCFNCGAGMHLNIYEVDVEMCLLVRRMALEVDGELKKGTPFTQANLTHVMRLETSDAIRHAITRARYMGLVAQSPKMRHSGLWAITRWGYRLLAGGAVPRTAVYWRQQLLERSKETVTMEQALSKHRDSAIRALDRGRQLKNDYRAEVEAWNPADWTATATLADVHMPDPDVRPISP